MPASHVSVSRSTLVVFSAPCVEAELYTILFHDKVSSPLLSYINVDLHRPPLRSLVFPIYRCR